MKNIVEAICRADLCDLHRVAVFHDDFLDVFNDFHDLVDSDPAFVAAAAFVATLGAEHFEAFINFLLDAENGAALTNWNYYASPNAAAEPFIDEEVLNDPVVYPADQSKLEFIADTGDFEINFSDAFTEAKG